MRSLRAWFVRFGNLFSKKRSEREIADEIESHLQFHIEDGLRNGLAPGQARRQASIRLGGVEAAKEAWRDRRGIPFLETLWKDIVYAFRMMGRNKGWTAVAVLSLALGIGANTAIFSVFESMMLGKLPVIDPDELVAFRWAGDNNVARSMIAYGYSTPDPILGQSAASFTADVGEEFRAASRTLDAVFAFAPAGSVRVGIDGEQEVAESQYVSGEYYRALKLSAVQGRLIELNDDMETAEPVAVVSEEYWRNRFGADTEFIGETIAINEVLFTIVGIAPAGIGDLQRTGRPTPDISIPLAMEPQLTGGRSRLRNRGAWWLHIMARMKPGFTTVQVRDELAPVLDRVARSQATASQNDVRIPSLLVVPGSHGVYDLPSNVVTALAILAGVFAIVLVIVCVNVANLMLSRDETRARETAVRAAIGASRARLVRQFLTESTVLVTLGAFGALGLAHAGLVLAPIDGIESRILGWSVLGFVGIVTLSIGVLLGTVSAIGASCGGPGSPTRLIQRRLGQSRSFAGKSLVAAQVALSLVLLIVAGLFLRTLENLQSVPTGFNPDNLVLLSTPVRGVEASSRRNLLERLDNLPGVQSVTASSDALFGTGQVRYSIDLDPNDPETIVDVATFWVGAGFLETQQIPLRRGRTFSASDEQAGPAVAIVNEAFIREFLAGFDQEPIGYRLAVFGSAIEIVGVSGDAKYGSLRDEAPAMLYIVDPEQSFRLTRYLIRTEAAPDLLIPAIGNAARDVSRDLGTPRITTQRDMIAQMYNSERLFALSSSLFGGLGLLISMIGLFGLLSYTVTRRTREIGIRMALGARKGTVVASILRESLVLVSVGVVLGLGAAAAVTRYIESLLFGLGPNDSTTIAGAVILMLAVSGAAAYLPARRASRVDPMVALRDE